MSDSNKEMVRAFYEQVWNAHNPEATGDYYAANFADYNPAVPNMVPGAEGAQQVFATYLAAFPDLHFTLDLEVAEGDVVATRWTAQGTNSGAMMGMPPTGRSVAVTGIDIFRLQDGKIAERWGNFDLVGMMRQLGMVQ